MRAILTAALAAALAVVFAGATRAADEWGTVKGQVTWGGAKPPAEKVINTGKEPKCADCKVVDEEFVVGKNGGVRYVFVWLQKGDNFKTKLPIHPALKAIKDKEVVMDQPCCKFEPRVLAIREGQTVIGKNSSKEIAHNMKWTGGDDNPGDNKLIPAGGQIKISDLVASKSPIAVECNIHPWMKGWVRVFSHPYFAVTDADGKFEIKNAPAGEYNIVMWQEGIGWVNGGKAGKKITIPAGGTVEVNEKLKPEDK
ncbi:MAG TPA: hypothetical protein VFW33_12225 [Gemmataceae bacterium]|nr:hypothetical protein [Gemmataceae bacterium]